MELLFFLNSWNPRIQGISRIVFNFPEFKDFHSPIFLIFKNVILQIPRIPRILKIPGISGILRIVFSNLQEIKNVKM